MEFHLRVNVDWELDELSFLFRDNYLSRLNIIQLVLSTNSRLRKFVCTLFFIKWDHEVPNKFLTIKLG